MAKEVILTKEGYEKLKQEIDYLSTDKRREVAERIRVAREFGDIAENSEYDDAKNEQALVEHRIALLEERLLSARVIEKKDLRAALQRMLDADECYVLDVMTPFTEHVMPMIPAGKTYRDIIIDERHGKFEG